MAEKTAAQKRAQKTYMEKFAVARVRMEHGQYEHVQAHAASHDESVNAFITRAITETMERDTAPQEAARAPVGVGVVSLPSEAIKTAQEAADAAGEDVPAFVARAIESRAKLDKKK